MEKHFLSDPEKIVVQKKGNSIFLLMRFSPEKNVATRFIEGNENAYFLPVDAPLEEIFKGRLFAECWDNAAPLWMEKHQHLGANHGSAFAFRVHLLRHWLFASDIGKILVDDAGKRFVLVSVDSLSDFTIHSDFPASGENFCTKVTGNLHFDGRTIVPESVTGTQLTAPAEKQLSHHRRYNTARLLADGTHEIADGETVECHFAELRWDMDLIFPEALLEELKKHPGKALSPVDPGLPAAMNCRMVTTFRPRCTRTVEGNFTILQDIPESLFYGMMQFYGGIGFSDHERLVPGVKPVTTDGGAVIDLAAGFRFPAGFRGSRYYTKKDCSDPAALPCRFIDFFGNGGKRELGVVLGYSLTQGITARGCEAERGDHILFLHYTTKMYPFAYECAHPKQGDTFRIYAYEQFFLPDPSGISCCHHQEKDGYYLYADFPAAAEYPVTLPLSLAGKTAEIIEADPGISVKGGVSRVPENGILVLSASGKGGIVCRIR